MIKRALISVSDKTGITDEAELKARVEVDYPLGNLDFRTH